MCGFEETLNMIYHDIIQRFQSCWFPQTCWMTQPDPIIHLANLIEKKQCSKLQLPSVMHLYSFARDSHYGFRSWSPLRPLPKRNQPTGDATPGWLSLVPGPPLADAEAWDTAYGGHSCGLTQHIEVPWGSEYTGNLHLYACLEGYGMFKWTNDALKDL